MVVQQAQQCRLGPTVFWLCTTSKTLIILMNKKGPIFASETEMIYDAKSLALSAFKQLAYRKKEEEKIRRTREDEDHFKSLRALQDGAPLEADVNSSMRPQSMEAQTRKMKELRLNSSALGQYFPCEACKKYALVEDRFCFTCESCGAVSNKHKTVSLPNSGNLPTEDAQLSSRGEVYDDRAMEHSLPPAQSMNEARSRVRSQMSVASASTSVGTRKASNLIQQDFVDAFIANDKRNGLHELSTRTFAINRAASNALSSYCSRIGQSATLWVQKQVHNIATNVAAYEKSHGSGKHDMRADLVARVAVHDTLTRFDDSELISKTNLSRSELETIASELLNDKTFRCDVMTLRAVRLLIRSNQKREEDSEPIAETSDVVAVSPSETSMKHRQVTENTLSLMCKKNNYKPRRMDSDVSSRTSDSVASSSTISGGASFHVGRSTPVLMTFQQWSTHMRTLVLPFLMKTIQTDATKLLKFSSVLEDLHTLRLEAHAAIGRHFSARVIAAAYLMALRIETTRPRPGRAFEECESPPKRVRSAPVLSNSRDTTMLECEAEIGTLSNFVRVDRTNMNDIILMFRPVVADQVARFLEL